MTFLSPAGLGWRQDFSKELSKSTEICMSLPREGPVRDLLPWDDLIRERLARLMFRPTWEVQIWVKKSKGTSRQGWVRVGGRNDQIKTAFKKEEFDIYVLRKRKKNGRWYMCWGRGCCYGIWYEGLKLREGFLISWPLKTWSHGLADWHHVETLNLKPCLGTKES